MNVMEIDDLDDNSGKESNNPSDEEDMDVEGEERGSGSEDEADVDEDEEAGDVPSSKKKRNKRKRRKLELDAKGKPKLSSKQMKELKEAEVMGQSSFYRFQIDELLTEIQVKTNVRVKVLEWLTGFKSLVNSLKPSKQYSLNSVGNFLEGVEVPFPDHIHPKGADKSTFEWIRPESILEVGSWAYQTPVAKLSAFDIAVEMPAVLFHKSDVKNHIYHLKRAVYMAYLAKEIQNCGDEVNFRSTGDPLKPILQIYVKSKKVLNVQIHFVLPKGFEKFPKSRLQPTKNNIRADYFIGSTLEGEDTGPFTPSYNHSILYDLYFLSNNEFTTKSIGSSKTVYEAIKLLKVWLTQRSLNQGFGSFSNYIMTMFVIYLLHNGKIDGNMNSYQIIRIVFQSLTQSDWCRSGISFQSMEKEKLDEWHSAHEVVFLDHSSQLNLTANMTRLTFNRVKIEAKSAIDSFSSASTNAFHSMFITKVPFLLNFDNILQIQITEDLCNRLKTDKKWSSFYLNFSGYNLPLAARVIAPIVETCFGKRAKLIDIQLPQVSEWEIHDKHKEETTFRLGIIIDRDYAFKLVERCESEDGTIAKQFKEFWGEKSQLRRFLDGTMMESVSFEGEVESDQVLFKMLEYILERHVGIRLNRGDETYLDSQLDRLFDPKLLMTKLVEPVTRRKRSISEPTNKRMKFYHPKEKKELVEPQPVRMDNITSMASKSFDSLSKMLRQLEGLPLDITSVQGTSPVLRFTNIYPTPPQRFATSTFLTEVMGSSLKLKEPEGPISKVTKHVEPIGVIVQLESSGKWPDDIKAMERLKCAFLMRIGQLLQEQFELTVQFFPRYLYVLKDGFVFRIRLTCFRELTLLKQIRENGILHSRDNPESLALEKESLILPQLTSTLSALHRQFGAFGKTCRLAKRWVASHLLLGSQMDHNISVRHPDIRFTEESIELLVASLFLQHSPFLFQPNEAQLGFLRFLNLLGNTDWKSTSFILNFNEKLQKSDIEKIESEFVKRRETLPLLFIATPEDKLGSVWTKHLSPTILQRAAVLAKFALDTLITDLSTNSADEEEATVKLRKIFKPSTKVFDAIIWIKKETIPRKAQAFNGRNLKLTFNEYTKRPEEVMPIVDFDPVRLYFQELRETFGHLCTFVTDIYGGNFIALAWKPDATEARNFEISQVRGRKLLKDGKTLGLDLPGILEEMEFMGEGIVDYVEVKPSTGK